MESTRKSSDEVPLIDGSPSSPDLSGELGKTDDSRIRLGERSPAPQRDPQEPDDLEDIFAEAVEEVPSLESAPSTEKAGPLSQAGISATRAPVALAGYEFIRKIGVGGFGAVYLAYEKHLDREVALKVLSRNKATRPDFVERFKREALVSVRLEHPNIVRGYNLLIDERDLQNRVWHGFVMEYIDGDNMQTWCRKLKRLSVGDALNIVRQIAAALEYAHERKFVHRDIKPENILIARNGVAKLADLGLAKALADEEDPNLTGTGIGFGTPYYMAPEQAKSAKTVDHRSDIYALGTTLYLFLTGELPFKGESALELIHSKLSDGYPPIRKLNPNVPDHVDLIVGKMLQRNPKDRYQSCSELIRDIERLGLASRRLSFLPPQPGEVVAEPNLTQQLDIAVQSTAKSETLNDTLGESRWLVRSTNAEGKEVTRQFTTRQLQETIKDPRFDLKSLLSRAADGEFRPLASFPEFQGSLRARFSQAAKARADRRGPKLQKAYEQLQTEFEERERQRKEEAEQKPIKELMDHPAVSGMIGSVQRWWEESKMAATPTPTPTAPTPVPKDVSQETKRTSTKTLLIVIGLGTVAGLIFLRFLFYILGKML